MRTFSIPILILCLCAGLRSAAPALAADGPEPLALDDVLREVRAKNPALAAAKARTDASRERISQERAWEDPALVYEASIAGESDQSVKLQQTLPLSGRNRSRSRIAEAAASGAANTARKTELEIVRDARNAYFQYAAAQGLLDLNTREGELLQQIAETSRSRLESGNQTQAEVLLAESELAKNSEVRVDLDRQMSEAQSALNRLMHRPPRSPLPPPPEFSTLAISMPGFDLTAMQAAALSHNPEMGIARARIAENRAQVELANRQKIPDPAAALKGRRFTEDGERMAQATLEISLPLPWANGRKYAAGVREAKANLEASQAELDATADAIRARVRDGARKVESYGHHVELFREKIIPLSREAVNAARISYEAGKTALEDVLNAQRKLRDDEAELLRHSLDFQMARAELDAVTGTPSSRYEGPAQSTAGPTGSTDSRSARSHAHAHAHANPPTGHRP